MAITDYLLPIRDGGAPVVTTVDTARAIGGTTLSCVDLDNWPQSTVAFVTFRKDSDGNVDNDTIVEWRGIVSGNTISSLTVKEGSDAGNAIGDFVAMAPTTSWAEGIYDFANEEHYPATGKHKDVTADSVTTEDLTASGNVTLPTGSIETADLANSAVTGEKLSDTGWISITPNAGFTNAPQYRKIANLVYFRGIAAKDTVFAANDNPFDLPAEITPSSDTFLIGHGTNDVVRMNINADGTVVVNSVVNFNHSFIIMDTCSFLAG